GAGHRVDAADRPALGRDGRAAGPVRALRGGRRHAAARPAPGPGRGPGRAVLPAVADEPGQRARPATRERRTGGGLGRCGQPRPGAPRRRPDGRRPQGDPPMTSVGRELRERLDSVRASAARVTPGTLLVRGAVFAFVIAALLVAFPAQVLGEPAAAAALVVLAGVPALVPRTRFTTAVVLIAVLGWLAATTAYFEPVTLSRL